MEPPKNSNETNQHNGKPAPGSREHKTSRLNLVAEDSKKGKCVAGGSKEQERIEEKSGE